MNEDEDYDAKNLNKFDLELQKKVRIMDKKLNEILKEIGIYFLFLFILYYVSFSNLSNSAYTYNKLFDSTFVQQQNSNEMGLNNVICEF